MHVKKAEKTFEHHEELGEFREKKIIDNMFNRVRLEN